MDDKNYVADKSIPVSQLLLDVQNPRLPDVASSQREAIIAMLENLGNKIIVLAQHIQRNGPNLATLLIVIPSKDDTGKYIVLDGNRRLTALRLLETPSLASEHIDNKSMQKLKQMAVAFAKEPISSLRCVVYPSREDADKWIELTHRGYNSGAGLVGWDGQVGARYDARKGAKDKQAALQVLEFVKNNANLSSAATQTIASGKFPITNLERLLNTPYVRQKLGIDISKDGVTSRFSTPEIIGGLTRIVEDLSNRNITVSHLKSQAQRIDYINGFDPNELPNFDMAHENAVLLGERRIIIVKNADEKKAVKKGSLIYSTRTTLIPKNCKLNVTHPRLQKIYLELRKLNVDDYPNCGAVMLRVFLELSLDFYLENIIKREKPHIQGMKLSEKLNSVINYIESKSILHSDQLVWAKIAAKGNTLLVTSVKTLHSYIHNQHFSPLPSDIKAAWDNLQPIFEKIWLIK